MQEATTHEQRQDAAPARFIFLANALALDLINTNVVLRRRRCELLPTSEALARWWEAARGHYPEIAPMAQLDQRWRNGDLFTATRQLRAALHVLFDAWVAGHPLDAAAVAPLNRILRLGYQAVQVTAGGEPRPGYGVHGEEAETLLVPIALSAYELLTRADRARLRHCDNPYCVALFFDTSKSATRRWCSVGCMNRARSAARYALAKGEQARA
jgi:predicted RNA-binding Zn ribbon-like protein